MKKETFHLAVRFLAGLALSLLICAGMILTGKLGGNKPLIQQASGLKGSEVVMTVDGEVRLMGAYIVRCGEIIKNEDGTIREIHVTADLETGNGNPTDGRKIKGTIHWVSAPHAVDASLRYFENLTTLENPANREEGKDYTDYINPDSVRIYEHAKLEPALAEAKPGDRYQFVRCGYFCMDSKYENTFNRTVSLKDSFKEG